MAFYSLHTIEETYVTLYISPDANIPYYRVMLRPSSTTTLQYDKTFTLTAGQDVTIYGLTGGVNYSLRIYAYTVNGGSVTQDLGLVTFTTPGAVVTYTATLYFNANGGYGAPAAVSESSMSEPIYVTIPTTTPYKTDGSAFLGWGFDDIIVSFYPGQEYPFAQGVRTLYAVWQGVYTATISYNANGGSGAPTAQTFTSTVPNVTVTLSSVIPKRSGYVFVGWAYSSTATVAEFSSGETTSFVNGSHTLYAVWSVGASGDGGYIWVADSNQNWRKCQVWVADSNQNWRSTGG